MSRECASIYCTIVQQQVSGIRDALPEFHMCRHEVIRAKAARRLGSAAEVLYSAQQVSFLEKLFRFLVKGVHARENVRRHHQSCERTATASEAKDCKRQRGLMATSCSEHLMWRLPRTGRRSAAMRAPCQRRPPRRDSVALQRERQRRLRCARSHSAQGSHSQGSDALAAARVPAAGAERGAHVQRVAEGGATAGCQVSAS